MKISRNFIEELKNKHLLKNKYFILLLVSIIIAGVLAVTYLSQASRSQNLDKPKSNTSKNSTQLNKSKVITIPGATNVKTFSQAYKEMEKKRKLKEQQEQEMLNKTNALGSANISGSYYGRYYDVPDTNTESSDSNPSDITTSPTPPPAPTATPKPLPYPRISINYSLERTSSIRTENAGNDSMFLIITLDIRNYGYKYFDAHPTKFRILKGNSEIRPIVNVSTGNMIDEVIPNNSRAKGDLIFLLNKGQAAMNPKIKYFPDDYKILYNLKSSNEMNEEDEGEEEDEEEQTGGIGDYYSRYYE